MVATEAHGLQTGDMHPIGMLSCFDLYLMTNLSNGVSLRIINHCEKVLNEVSVI